MANENQEDLEMEVVELIDEDGKEHKYVHIGTIEYKGEWYCFFQPSQEDEDYNDEDGNVVIFKVEGEEDNETLAVIEDEELLNEVFEEYCRLLDEEDCDCGDDDCDCGCCEGGKCDCSKDKE